MKSSYLALALVSILFSSCQSEESIQGPAEESRQPNIVLILVDDMGYMDIGAFGSEVSTPNIDALARESTLFTDFYCASFPTGPMRKDLFSGRFTFPYASWATPRRDTRPAAGGAVSCDVSDSAPALESDFTD